MGDGEMGAARVRADRRAVRMMMRVRRMFFFWFGGGEEMEIFVRG